MLNKDKLNSALVKYKSGFMPQWWREERFKWQAIKCFQDNWDIDAPDFAEMLDRSLAKTSNLLASYNHFPKAMITEFADASPEEVRSMFADLFDENRDVVERIDRFKAESAALLKKYKSDAANHYQDENAISVYLWLRFPDKYYIYKFGVVRDVANYLEADYVFKKKSYTDNMRNFYKFYDEICDAIKEDAEVTDILKSYIDITEGCHLDPNLKTLTVDFCFFISQKYGKEHSEDDAEWLGLDYDPGLSAEDWSRLLRDGSVFTKNALEIMKRLKDCGGMATCTQLAIKYGETKNFYNSGSVALARRVCVASGVEPNIREDGSTQWWTVLYTGRYADAEEEGSFVWRLRDELSEALDGLDLSGVKLYAPAGKVRYWLCAPGDGACIWDECVSKGIIAIGWDELGDYREYSSKQEMAEAIAESYESSTKPSMAALATWQFLNDIKPGDIIFAKKGLYSVLGRGVVEGDYEYDPSREKFKNIRRVRWTDIAEVRYPGTSPQKTLTDITDKEDIVKQLNALYDSKQASLFDNHPHGYWWLNANPKLWNFSEYQIGEVQSYTLYNENGNKRRIFQNFLDAKAGDMIIGYESYPTQKIVAIARISEEQDGYELFFEKVEQLETPIEYSKIKGSPELKNMEYFQNPQGSLFKLTKEEYDFIMKLIREENPSAGKYTKTDFLNEVYMDEKRYDSLVAVLGYKKNIILQGAPGVGKTFAAKRLAWSIMGEKDDSRIESVQFHQNYSYEDFVMGYKPKDDTFVLTDGVFYKFCQKASEDKEKEFFFIIDEINRGNLSKIFGELLMLIENEHRGEKIKLAYKDEKFSVPENLYIIGMMNTADRSLALIDYALRRRFSFFEMEPAFESEGFKMYQAEMDSETLDRLVEAIKELNKDIIEDKSLEKGFCIGHSYFCFDSKDKCTDGILRAIVECDIIPTLREYWFDNKPKQDKWVKRLMGVFND